MPAYACKACSQHHLMEFAACKLLGDSKAMCNVLTVLRTMLPDQEFAPAPPLLPPHPALRAKARIIIDHFDRQFTPLFYRILIRSSHAGCPAYAFLCYFLYQFPAVPASRTPFSGLIFAGLGFLSAPMPVCSCSTLFTYVRGAVQQRQYDNLATLCHARDLQEEWGDTHRWLYGICMRGVKGTRLLPEQTGRGAAS